ncbi:uncharacterized protein BKCO1_450007 [Diplodia corticola]|uniref:Uncharacterized protein n=1 Tax=Diplodia corticola TaxID=236234 RepID=A0A1J9RGP9_9PEZI|nr:uncharacterized protein BKCO1_450007 [Diplodia corticola]OJD31715.1 hypothetical protein BKCO1_450007 [Diplodia corticola]
MVLSMLLALNAAPALMGTQEAIRQSQSKEKREEHRARRCNLIATCVKPSIRSREINGRQVVLRDNKLYIDAGTSSEDNHPNTEENERQHGHPFAGYFLPYPDAEFEGLVSTITDVAPILNWIYVDKDTGEVKYGVRADSQPHVTGPFDCTHLDRRLMLEGWEGFVAVEEYPAVWAIYFDRDDDGLKGKIPFGTRVLEIELQRREKKVTPEVMREARREQELFRLQMEQNRQQQEFAPQQETQLDFERTEQPVQQTLEEDADAESQVIDAYDGTPAVSPQVPPDTEHALDACATQHQSDNRKHSGNVSQNHVGETDLAGLKISTGADSDALADHAEETATTPTDTNCGASIWSTHEISKSVKDDSAVFHATPDSSVQGDDEIAAVEAVFRQNDAVGAPPLLWQKYKKPHVEDE